MQDSHEQRRSDLRSLCQFDPLAVIALFERHTGRSIGIEFGGGISFTSMIEAIIACEQPVGIVSDCFTRKPVIGTSAVTLGG
jgi:hypothetical protein